jgi:hypothetical protein
MAATGRWRSVIARNVGVDVTNFDGLLSSLDSKVQTALDTLDDVAVGGAASVTTSAFDGILSASEDTVQKCLDVIDDMAAVKGALTVPGTLSAAGVLTVTASGSNAILNVPGSENQFHLTMNSQQMLLVDHDGVGWRFYYSGTEYFRIGDGIISTQNAASIVVDGITISADSIANDAALTVAAANSEALILKGGPVQIYDTDWSTYAEMYGSSGDFIIRNTYTTGGVDIKGYKAGPTQVTMISADPGGFVTLWYDTTQALRTQAAGITLMTNPATILDQNGETWVSMDVNGSVTLYYDNTLKVATYADGISITGGTVLIDGTARQIVSNASFNILVGSTESAIVCTQNGAVELYYDNTKTFETTASGISFGDGTYTGSIQIVASGEVYWVNDTTNKNAYISIKDNAGVSHNVFVAVTGATPYARLQHDNVAVLEAISGGVQIIGSSNTFSLTHDGTDTKIITDVTAASDLIIDCGTNKTLELAEPVWDDIVVATSTVRFGGASPVSDQAYKGGSVASYSNASDNYLYFTIELPHDYKEGTDIKCHFHYVLPVAGSASGVENVKFDLSFCASEGGGAFGSPDTTGTTTFDVQNTAVDDLEIQALHTITGTNLKVSDTLICHLKRDTSVATPYGNPVYVIEVDFHYQKDTMGSRQEFTK